MRTRFAAARISLIVAPLGTLVLAACSRGDSARVDTSTPTGSVAASDSARASTATTMVRGTIASVSGTTIGIQGDSGTTTVQVAQPLRVYDRQPATLADVTPNSFIGVTTVKQPDGSQQATEIHIFPEELRGLGEGSRPMAPTGAGAANGKPGSTMTNGAAGSQMTNGSASTMTNGSASGSTMSNGKVSSAGSQLVVQYAGGTMKATVPSSTPVMKIVAVPHTLAAGDRVVVVATKQANGSLTTNRVMMTNR